ncbi:MAG TPA: serine hydrolase domain-containing protein [Terriglobales bacterium]|nr:serine hydrolase domain-containing protein [Terriglobales bacterium]
MFLKPLVGVAVLFFCAGLGSAQSNSLAEAMGAYLEPYVDSGNFAGDILVERNGRIVFERSYGFADRERRIHNTPATRFHIASMSMQFTAGAVLRLVDAGSIRLDELVGTIVPGISGADRITIRDLLTERSGLPDINSFPNYDDILQHHQTPASLIAKIKGQPLLFPPGSKFQHEEHSAYNLLALIVEKRTGLSFRAAVDHLIFRPVGLTASGIDDDSAADSLQDAKGYEPFGTYALKPAALIHWSAKTGNASAFTTARDEARWVQALFRGHVLRASSREAVLDTSMSVGYGWFKGQNKRFNETAYYMNGRAPGFASFVLYLPRSETTVVVLSNIYSSVTTTIGNDIAALSVGLSYQPFQFQHSAPSPSELKNFTGTFQFGADFYQPNAKVVLIPNGRDLSLRWPSGTVSWLIPLDRDRFLDRSYWEEVMIGRDASGRASTLVYGVQKGTRVAE